MNANVKKEYFLTKDGVEKLKEELEDLTGNQRQKIAVKLREAKEYGDLSENIQWDDAKDQQAFIEGRIAEIEHILKHAQIIESKGKRDAVDLGCKVHVELEEGKQVYTIVGSTEANPEQGKISNESPIGRALMGKRPGEEVEVAVPSGSIVYKILKIE